jgi:hypothetical protein
MKMFEPKAQGVIGSRTEPHVVKLSDLHAYN